jgi:hypothetical protein
MLKMEIEPIITPINPDLFLIQDYTFEDFSIVSSFEIESTFIPNVNNVDYFIYDANKVLLQEGQLQDYFFTEDPNIVKTGGYSTINIDPVSTLKNKGYDVGVYNVLYTFFQNELNSSFLNSFFIKEISSDRTELRLVSNTISNLILTEEFNILQLKLNSTTYFNEFYLNFGNNQNIIGINIALDGNSILIKLYQPLPPQFDIKSKCFISTKVADPIGYNVSFIQPLKLIDENIEFIKGPNYNLQIQQGINNSTDFKSNNDILNTTLTSSFQQVQSLLQEKSVDINVDYITGSSVAWENFVKFGSAEQRIKNFYNKVSLIQGYQNDMSTRIFNITGSTSSSFYVSSSRVILQNKINNIIKNFDDFEYYLYFTTSSISYPKTNSNPPYSQANTESEIALNWLNTYTGSGAVYDNLNQNNLIYLIPEFIRNESLNTPYFLFIKMMGQHFDNVWVYSRDITNKFDTDNRLDYGASKDLIGQILRDLGIKIYSNNFQSDDIYTSLLGITPLGSLISQISPNTTGSLPIPSNSGLEYITSYITASSQLIPSEDLNKMLYKRLYHNLSYLLKKKGTLPAIKALINTYGIPDTILRTNEFGGKDKINTNDWDYWYRKFNYAYKQNGDNFISSLWSLNSAWASPNNVPATLIFRFKTNGLPTSNIPKSQSLWIRNGQYSSSFATSLITLFYSGSGYTSASYSGSIIDPYYQYATLSFIPDYYSSPPHGSFSASIYLPFFDGGWWSVMITSGSGGFNFFSKNSIYNGYDGNQIGFQASSSISGYQNGWMNDVANSSCSFGREFTLNIPGKGSNWANFSGSFQEIRYYNTIISENDFNNYVVNSSYIGNPNTLAFRASLGGELYTGSTSIHPKVTGSWATTSSFANNSNFFFSGSPYFNSNEENVFINEPQAGIQNRVNDKISIENTILPEGDTLSPYISIQQNSFISQSYTPNFSQLEVAFSPQNEINDDISAQHPGLNLGEYIGDPRQVSSRDTFYPDLNILRDTYFQKYLNGYARLIKYFDNSLFKLIQDFTPARTSLATGLVIKPHLLERNKYPVPQLKLTSSIAYGGGNVSLGFQNILITASINSRQGLLSGSIIYTASQDHESFKIETITGSQAGYLNTTQSWSSNKIGLLGNVNFIQNEGTEFYNGEFSGSSKVVTNGELTTNNPFLDVYDQNLNTGSSDYNILINNVLESPKIPNFVDIDYTQGSPNPTNWNFIISSSTNIYNSQIQLFNYNTRKSKNHRYEGSKLISLNYNEFSIISSSGPITSFFTEDVFSYSRDISYGKEPVINYNSYMSYNTEFVNGLFPELYNYTALNIKEAVIHDSKGNVIETINQQNLPFFNSIVKQYTSNLQKAEIFSNTANPIRDTNIIFSNEYVGGINTRYFIPKQALTGSTSINLYKDITVTNLNFKVGNQFNNLFPFVIYTEFSREYLETLTYRFNHPPIYEFKNLFNTLESLKIPIEIKNIIECFDDEEKKDFNINMGNNYLIMPDYIMPSEQLHQENKLRLFRLESGDQSFGGYQFYEKFITWKFNDSYNNIFPCSFIVHKKTNTSGEPQNMFFLQKDTNGNYITSSKSSDKESFTGFITGSYINNYFNKIIGVKQNEINPYDYYGTLNISLYTGSCPYPLVVNENISEYDYNGTYNIIARTKKKDSINAKNILDLIISTNIYPKIPLLNEIYSANMERPDSISIFYLGPFINTLKFYSPYNNTSSSINNFVEYIAEKWVGGKYKIKYPIYNKKLIEYGLRTNLGIPNPDTLNTLFSNNLEICLIYPKLPSEMPNTSFIGNNNLAAVIWENNLENFPIKPILNVNRTIYFPDGLGDKGGYIIPNDFDKSIKSKIFTLKSTPVKQSITQILNNLTSNVRRTTGEEGTTTAPTDLSTVVGTTGEGRTTGGTFGGGFLNKK